MLGLIDSTRIIIMANIKEELKRIRGCWDGKQRRGDEKRDSIWLVTFKVCFKNSVVCKI
jgi:hypothetical protein